MSWRVVDVWTGSFWPTAWIKSLILVTFHSPNWVSGHLGSTTGSFQFQRKVWNKHVLLLSATFKWLYSEVTFFCSLNRILHFQSYQPKMCVLTTRATIWTRTERSVKNDRCIRVQVIPKVVIRASNTSIRTLQENAKNVWHRLPAGLKVLWELEAPRGCLNINIWTVETISSYVTCRKEKTPKLKVHSVLALIRPPYFRHSPTTVHHSCVGGLWWCNVLLMSSDPPSWKSWPMRDRCLNSPEEAPTSTGTPTGHRSRDQMYKVQVGSTTTDSPWTVWKTIWPLLKT